jgi:hypothetical protein
LFASNDDERFTNKIVKMEDDWRDVAKCFLRYGNMETYSKFKSFFKNETNPRRKLRTLVKNYQANLPEVVTTSTEPPYGSRIDGMLRDEVKLHMKNNNNEIGYDEMRSKLLIILEDNQKTYLLKENGGICRFGRKWAARALVRWQITNRKQPYKSKDIHTNIVNLELSTQTCKDMMRDRSSILRRRPDDPLPCRILRDFIPPKLRYEDEDEENCWVNTIGLEATSKLTMKERLLLPCSIRS